MRKVIFAIIIATLCMSGVNAQSKSRLQKVVEPTSRQVLQTKVDSVSYAFGVYLGNDLARNLKTFPGMEVKTDVLLSGIRQSLSSDSVPMTVDFASQYFQNYITAAQNEEISRKKAAGQVFLDENKKRPEVSVTPSELQYEVLTQSEGPKPVATDEVKVHYTGKLTDGTVFDSSVERGEPITFPLGGVIRGWTEGLQLMSVGSKYRLYIPSDLGYGERGAGNGAIPPSATLIFDVELLEINPSK